MFCNKIMAHLEIIPSSISQGRLTVIATMIHSPSWFCAFVSKKSSSNDKSLSNMFEISLFWWLYAAGILGLKHCINVSCVYRMSTFQQTLYNVHRKFAKRVLALFVRINDKNRLHLASSVLHREDLKKLSEQIVYVWAWSYDFYASTCHIITIWICIIAGFSASLCNFFSPLLSLLVSEVTKWRVCWQIFSSKMQSRITNSESINLSDSYTVLLDETLRENRVLRAMLIEQDEQNVRNFRGLSDKVESLCHLMSERNHAEPNERLLKKKSTSKVHVPSRCRVSLGCLNCFFMIQQLHFVMKAWDWCLLVQKSQL